MLLEPFLHQFLHRVQAQLLEPAINENAAILSKYLSLLIFYLSHVFVPEVDISSTRRPYLQPSHEEPFRKRTNRVPIFFIFRVALNPFAVRSVRIASGRHKGDLDIAVDTDWRIEPLQVTCQLLTNFIFLLLGQKLTIRNHLTFKSHRIK